MRRAKPFPHSITTSLLLFLSSCSPLYRSQSNEAALANLRKSIDNILTDSIFVPARVGIKVISLGNAEVLFERNGKALFQPASNLKLLTAATALHELGKGYEFRTVIYSDSVVRGGDLRGNLCIKGFGNPDLTTTDLKWMVGQLKDNGLGNIQGDIVGDTSFFDDMFWGRGWMWDDEPSSSEPFITPLSINKNSVKVLVSPRERLGDSVRVRFEPETRYVDVDNGGITGLDTEKTTIEVTRRFKDRLNTIVVKGTLPRASPELEFELSVWDPALYALTLFREELERDGITVQGGLRLGSVQEGATQLVEHDWPIDSVLIKMDKMSDNLSAENLLKVIAAEKRGPPGTAMLGISVVNEFLSSLEVDTTSYLMVDGSGVSHYNLINAETIVELLSKLYTERGLYGLFEASLPVAGVDGTLEDRMKGTAAEGNVRAKTGTLSGVSSLSGYVHTQDGDVLAFSILMQNFIGSPRPYRDAQDKIVELLAGFRSKQTSELP
jgi:D-alanyl-D-alanine carboxypeptidase/D-alanyl-D-alanine-endopeptidase (penicillin-binding protein 4)